VVVHLLPADQGLLGPPDDRPLSSNDDRPLHQHLVPGDHVHHGVRRDEIVRVEPELLEQAVLPDEIARRVLEVRHEPRQVVPARWCRPLQDDLGLGAEFLGNAHGVGRRP
jgi:hypothetical protein